MASMEVRKILVGLDSSPRAAHVLETAVALAERFSAELILCHSVGIPFDFPADALGLSPTALPGIMEEAARRDLEARARSLPPDIKRKVDIQIGTPWQVICNLAKAEDADLVIIGSHGYSGLDRVIGTTAGRVVNHADRPVLVIREKPAPSA